MREVPGRKGIAEIVWRVSQLSYARREVQSIHRTDELCGCGSLYRRRRVISSINPRRLTVAETILPRALTDEERKAWRTDLVTLVT